MASLPGSIFEAARRALASGDFAAAVQRAQEADALVSATVYTSDYGASSNPTYSIIVVLYQRHEDLGEALRRLARYSDQPEFELILVNNGDLVAGEVSRHLKRFRWIDVGFNYGCSGGRNLGARAARGDFLIFVDDDGFMEEHAIEYLIDTIIEHEAVAVRGRVIPKRQGGPTASHYDLGDEVVHSVPNAEGISIWRRKEFLAQGGFDPLLAGGEGVALWSKMHQYFGPKAFLYTPHAILFHDYDPEHLSWKKARNPSIEAYFRFAYPSAERQRWEVALELAQRAIECTPGDAGLHHHLGNLLQRWGRLGEAEAAFRQAIELKPQLGGAHRQLSVILAEQDRQEEAMEAARRSIECPTNAGASAQSRQSAAKVGITSRGRGSISASARAQSRLGGAHRQLSLIFAQQDKREEAMEAARRAIDARQCRSFSTISAICCKGGDR